VIAANFEWTHGYADSYFGSKPLSQTFRESENNKLDLGILHL
jgi:hypothetical protein